MKLHTLIIRYATFAALATIANLATQRLVLLEGHDDILILPAIAAGTLVGLALKYVLDKRWIFQDLGSGVLEHGKKFSLYTIMGIATTAIFWGTETTFWYVWRSETMREIGAILGLSIGYCVKYNLDRRFVFTNSKPMKNQ